MIFNGKENRFHELQLAQGFVEAWRNKYSHKGGGGICELVIEHDLIRVEKPCRHFKDVLPMSRQLLCPRPRADSLDYPIPSCTSVPSVPTRDPLRALLQGTLPFCLA